MAIDVVYAILLVLAIIKGISRGFIVAVFSFVAIVAGISIAIKFSAVVAGWLQNNAKVSGAWLPLLSFILVMIIVIFLIRLMANLLQKSIELVLLGWVNKLGGIVLYFSIYTLLFSVLLFFIDKMHLLQSNTKQTSISYSFIQPWAPNVIENLGAILPFLKHVFSQLENFFNSIYHK